MEKEGWVDAEPMSAGDEPAIGWYLGDGQREKPIPPTINQVVRWLDRFRVVSLLYCRYGRFVAEIGLVLMVAALTAAINGQNVELLGYSVIGVGYWVTVAGIIGVVLGILAWLGTSAVEKLATSRYAPQFTGQAEKEF